MKSDPYWITARFESLCKCGEKVKRGDLVFYYPLSRTVLCPKCSIPAAREFNECLQDERGY